SPRSFPDRLRTRYERRPGARRLPIGIRGRRRSRPTTPRESVPESAGAVADREPLARCRRHVRQPDRPDRREQREIRAHVSLGSRPLRRAALALAVAATLTLGEASALETLPPLVAAAKSGEHAAALKLVEQGAGINDAAADGTTALHWAARFGDRELV